MKLSGYLKVKPVRLRERSVLAVGSSGSESRLFGIVVWHRSCPQASREKADKLNAELKKATGRAHEAAARCRASASVEHAYSASPRSPLPGCARVAPGLLHKLEELMLEGDLLEVRLEEQAQLWGAVLAARGAEGRRCSRVLDAGRRKRAQRQPRPHRQLKRTRPPLGAAKAKRQAATTTNYLNRKQVSGGPARAVPLPAPRSPARLFQGVSSGSGLMMRKHYMARQERRKRGLAPAARGKHPRQARMSKCVRQPSQRLTFLRLKVTTCTDPLPGTRSPVAIRPNSHRPRLSGIPL